jgi:hypothetical protein
VPESYDFPWTSVKAMLVFVIKRITMGIAAQKALRLSLPNYSGKSSSAFVLGLFGFGSAASMLDALPHSS